MTFAGSISFDLEVNRQSITRALAQVERAFDRQIVDVNVQAARASIEQASRQIDSAFRDQRVNIGVDIDTDAARQAIGRIDSQIDGLKSSLNGLGDSGGGIGRLGDVLTGVFQGVGQQVTEGLTQAIGSAIDLAGQFASSTVEIGSAAQQSVVAFETILGSAEQARETLGELQQFAANTPFEFTGVRDAGQSLLAFGFTTDQLIPSLTAVANVAAGVSTDFNELALIYGKARTQGTLFAEDINQLTERGIPIIAQLAEQFGVAESQVKKLVSEGSVTFADLEQAFISLTSEGGTFFNLVDKQSATFGGRLSNLGDTVDQFKIQLFDAFSPALSGLVATLSGILGEAGRNSDGLGDIAEAAGRLELALSSNPEIVESLGKAFGSLADTAVDQIAGIIDAFTAFASNQEAVDNVAQSIEDLGIVLQGLGRFTQGVIGFTEVFFSAGTAAENFSASFVQAVSAIIPGIGGATTAFETLQAVVSGIQSLFGGLGDAIFGTLDAALNKISEIVPAVEPLVKRIQGILDRLNIGSAVGDAVGDAASDAATKVGVAAQQAEQADGRSRQADQGAARVERGVSAQFNSEPPDTSAIEDKYKELTSTLEVEQAKQRAALIEGGATQEEIAKLEATQLQARIDQAQAKLGELQAVNQDALDPDGVESINQQILQTEQQIANDRVSLAQQTAQNIESAQRAALENLADATDKALSDIESSQNQRIVAIKQQQLAGLLTAEEAQAQIAGLEAETTDEIITQKKRELSEVQRLKAEGVISEEQAADSIRELQGEISSATIDRLDQEIDAQEKAKEAALAAQEEIKQATLDRLDAQLQAAQQLQEVRSGETDIASGAVSNQLSLLEAQFNVRQSLNELSQLEVENGIARAEAEGRVSDAAALRDGLLQRQVEAAQQEQAFKQQQLALTIQQNQLDAQRQIQLAEIAAIEAGIATDKARASGASAEELAGLQRIADLRQDQVDAARDAAANQDAINSALQDQLNIEGEIAKEQLRRNAVQEEINRKQKESNDLAKQQASTIAGAFSVSDAGSPQEAVGQVREQFRTAQSAGFLTGPETRGFENVLKDVERALTRGDDRAILRAAGENRDNPLFTELLRTLGRSDLAGIVAADQQLAQLREANQPIVTELQTLNERIEQLANTPRSVTAVAVSADPVKNVAQMASDLQRNSFARVNP